MSMSIQQRLVSFVVRSNWYIFVVASLLAFINTPTQFAMGVMLGGLIVTINFHILRSTLQKSLNPVRISTSSSSILNMVLVKYYIRFLISGIVIYLLITRNIVDPLGLIAGLSVVVASIMMATMLELTRLIFKEAV